MAKIKNKGLILSIIEAGTSTLEPIGEINSGNVIEKLSPIFQKAIEQQTEHDKQVKKNTKKFYKELERTHGPQYREFLKTLKRGNNG